MRRKESRRPIKTRLHNEMYQLIQNKPKKYSYYRDTTKEIVHLNSRIIFCNVVFIKYFNNKRMTYIL